MCLLFVAWRAHPRYRVVLAANRDEFHDRPTRPPAFWDEHPAIFAGRDLTGGGTWLGVTPGGRFAALTNIRGGGPDPARPVSRGLLVRDALLTASRPGAFAAEVAASGEQYPGFNLLVGNRDELAYYTNLEAGPRRLPSGIHGFSNAPMGCGWPKVTWGRERLGELVASDDTVSAEALLDMLADDRPAADADLPDTGYGRAAERALSACFIRGEHYGTRSSSVLLIDHDGGIRFVERRFSRSGEVTGTTDEIVAPRADAGGVA